MKKVIITVIAMVMFVALCGCNNTSTETVIGTIETLSNQRETTVDTIRDKFNSELEDEFTFFHAKVIDYDEGTIRFFMIAEIESDYGDYEVRIQDYDVDNGNAVLVINKIVNDLVEGLDVMDNYQA